MQTNHVKVVLIAAWVLAVGTLGVGFGVTSFAVWAVLAVLSLVPPALMWRLWSVPSPTMSESIRDALH